MGNDLLSGFIDKKKALSPFISLADGESIVVKLRNIKMITKSGFGGEEKEALRLECDVETGEGIMLKNFDNSTQRFAQELQDKGVKVGSTFTITRTGMMTKTRYTISDVSVSSSAGGNIAAAGTIPVTNSPSTLPPSNPPVTTQP